MHCPQCNASDTKVIDSRTLLEENTTRRRRKCDICEYRFTTYEKLHLQMPQIVKKDGRRESYNRDKMMKGLKKACSKRPISVNELEHFIDGIEKTLIDVSITEVSSNQLGKIIMDRLKKLDPVSYVRFASFYWDFGDIEDFVYGLKHNLNAKKDICYQGVKSEQ
jgi:transcriptional repressor NrdR